MAANFQHNMGGQGMMPQQRLQQQQQRPGQQGAGVGQIQNAIFHQIQVQTGPLSGWQASVLPQERMGLIYNIVGNLRLASQHQQNPPDLKKMMEIALKFEKDIFDKSDSKETYKHELQQKMDQVLEHRNSFQATMQQQIHQQAQNQAQNQQAMIQQQQQQQQQHQQQHQQQMMLNHQNGLQGQGQRPMPQQQNQQPFSHLQHQMQASPLPGQQIPQASIGMSGQGMQQNLTQNQQQHFQTNMEQQRIQQQNAVGRPAGPPQMSPQDTAIVQELINKMSSSNSEEERTNMRIKIMASIDPAILSKYQAQGVDPLQMYYRSQAIQQLKRVRMNQQMAMNQQSQQNMSLAAPAMQRQRSMNPSPVPGQVHPSAPMGGNADFTSFMGNMENTAAQQQQQGVIAEQAGQMVVPVSGGPRIPTPQPGVMGGQNPNDPRMVNPNLRAQQQQMLAQHLQLQQQQRMQQQQSQVQARLNAQNKAQQMGLQGQNGGMGPGPVPPQQSPAMSTLNTPMRTPSQQMNHPEGLQGNPVNANFGAPLDPRFMQGNQRQNGNLMGIPGFDPAMLSQMSPEAKQQMTSLPQDKLQEVVNKWNASRQGQPMGGHVQNGRPQMPMQGIPIGRPGQSVPQPGQFNPQAPASQFVAQNGGQRGPQPMVNSMNPAQQMALQQQMQRQQQSQQRTMPMKQEPQQQPNQQMDNVPFPPGLVNHANMPPGIPSEIKKWGQLKHWVMQNAQNLGLPAHTMDNVKQLQGMHYHNLLKTKSRQEQQMQGGNMQPNLGGQAGNTIPPGLSAPVAPMGPNPMQIQMPNGMNGQIRQPTPQDIQNYRNHMGAKMANVNDNDIRALYIRNMQNQAALAQQQMTPQQQQQQQAQRAQIMQQMQLQRMQQAQMQQNVQPQTHQMPQPQPKQAPIAPPKQAPTAPPKQAQQSEAAPPSTANNTAARAPRPQQNTKNQPQNSSPDQPAKNLKRASSSDDVVEVPNPNIPQSRPVSTQLPAKRTFPLPPAQVAALNPEQRKQYDRMLQHHQANRTIQIDPVKQEMLKTISKEEQEKFRDGPIVPMDEANKKITSATIMKILPPLINVGKILPKWFQETSNEATTREFFRLRMRIQSQFTSAKMDHFKDSFSISVKEVEHGENILKSMLKVITDKLPNLLKSNSTKAPTTAQAVAPPTPLNAANLANLQQEQHQQQLLKSHQRSNSRNSHTPAAPTSSQPPFQFGAPSPHGLPAYGVDSKITRDNLHIPARKKQKQNGTPGSNASPQVTKAASPEIKRQAESRHHVKALACSERDCDRHNIGFETEEALKSHILEEHVRPQEDSSSFAKENLALALGLDPQGKPKNSPSSTQQALPAAGVLMVPNGPTQGQIPNIKAEPVSVSGTPMSRQVSMNRQASAPGGKSNKASLAQNASTKLQSVQKEVKSPGGQQEAINPDPWTNVGIDQSECLNTFAPFETGAGGAISDMSVYRSITPNDTPESSKDGISEPNSDISEGMGLDINLDLFGDNWQPFGPSDIDNNFDSNGYPYSGIGDEDMAMFEGEPTVVNNYQWDDTIDPAAFDKPFIFDTSLYSIRGD